MNTNKNTLIGSPEEGIINRRLFFAPSLDQPEKEHLLAEIADVILIMDGFERSTKATKIEIDRFVLQYPRKTVVILPQKYLSNRYVIKRQLSSLPPGHVIGYTDIDLRSGAVVQMAIQGVDTIIFAKFLREIIQR